MTTEELASAIAPVESFLQTVGLKLLEDTGFQHMCNRSIRYGNDRIQVRLDCDRGYDWFIDVRDPLDNRPGSWCEMSLFRTLLTGAEDADLTLAEQAQVLEKHWNEILDRLGPAKAAETHAQLDALYQKRLRRLLPDQFK